MAHNYALTQITVKAIVRRGDEVLILKTPDEYIDFPGGRVDKDEITLPFDEILKREVDEELGTDVSFSVHKLAFIARRQYHHEGETHYITAIYYDVTFISGEIKISDEHSDISWKTPEQLFSKERKYISEDERVQLKKYLLAK